MNYFRRITENTRIRPSELGSLRRPILTYHGMSRLRRITSKAQEPDIETTPRNRDYSSSFADVHLQPLKRKLELETMLLSQSPATSAGRQVYAGIGAGKLGGGSCPNRGPTAASSSTLFHCHDGFATRRAPPPTVNLFLV